MIVVGLDWSRCKHDSVIMNLQGEILERGTIAHNTNPSSTARICNSLPLYDVSSYISADEAKTWAEYPIFAGPDRYEISHERAMICTLSGTVVLAFANNKEKASWNWRTDISDSPGAILPTYAVRSIDGGKNWQDLQKLHDDWTGAIRDIRGEVKVVEFKTFRREGVSELIFRSPYAKWKSDKLLGKTTKGTASAEAVLKLLQFEHFRSTDI